VADWMQLVRVIHVDRRVVVVEIQRDRQRHGRLGRRQHNHE